MDLLKFKKFSKDCLENLPGVIDEILKASKGYSACAIGFITTDDFYGFYLSWDYSNNIEEYYEWEAHDVHLDTDFLYQPIVDVVEGSEIDFCVASDEKWNFALDLLAVLEQNIKQIPDDVFQKNNYRREDVLFFSTMSDGDYIDEMLEASVKLFNAPETLKSYGLEFQ